MDRGVCLVLALRRDEAVGRWGDVGRWCSVELRAKATLCSCSDELLSLLKSVTSSWNDASDGVVGPELSDLTNGRYQFVLGPDDFQNLCC